MAFPHYICQVPIPQQQQQQQQQPATENSAVGGYSVPFPFEPYSVQRSVAASIRATCEIGGGAVCVLESPTGTGKSQALLNGVLSHYFAGRNKMVVSTSSATTAATATATPSSVSGQRRRDRETSSSVTAAVPVRPPSTSFARSVTAPSAQMEMKREEENDDDDGDDDSRDNSAESLLSRVNAFISDQDKLAQLVGKRSHSVSISAAAAASSANGDSAFLVNVADDASSYSSSSVLGGDAGARREGSGFFSSSSSSSSNSRNASDVDLDYGKEADEEEDDAVFADVFERFALGIGDSKVIYTSRTHSQLAQIIDEIEKGPFRFDQHHQQQPSNGSNTSSGIRYLHVGSRQQLCVNEDIRSRAAKAGAGGGGGDRLNELCKEATEEYRTAEQERKREEKKKNRKTTATTKQSDVKERKASSSSSMKAKAMAQQRARNETVAQILQRGQEGGAAGSSGDIEDTAQGVGGGCAGCEFSDQQRIQQLLRRMMQRPHSMMQLRELGRQLKACPFYATRYAVHFSQLLLMPYTYLVDDRMRSQMLSGGLRLAGDGGTSSSSNSNKSYNRRRHKKSSGSGGDDGAAAAAVDSSSSIPWQILVSQTMAERRRERREDPARHSSAAAAAAAANNAKNDSSSIVSSLDDDPTDDFGAILRSSILVIDEGHNLAESAAAACTASVRSDALASAVRTIDAYMTQFDTRLFISTKQRLRELRSVLISWLNFILGHKMMPAATAADGGSAQSPPAAGTQVVLGTYGLSPFSFETDTAHVNFFSLVEFLETNDAVTRIGYFGERHFALQQQKLILEREQTIVNLAAGKGDGNCGGASAAGGRQEQARQTLAELKQQEQRQLEMAKEFSQFVSPVKALREILRIAELLAKSPENGTVVAVLDEVQEQPQQQQQQQQSSPVRLLQILGLSPAQAVEPLTRKARATVIAGGTLQPFQLLQMELFPSYASGLLSTQQALDQFKRQQQQPQQQQQVRSPPPIIAEAFTHVVDPQRFLLFPVSTGGGSDGSTANTKLRFTRATAAQRPAMLHSVCTTLLQLSKIIPRGLVIFFPSFAMEEAFFAALDRSGLRQQIEQRKPIFREGQVAPDQQQNSGKTMKTTTRRVLRGEELFVEYSKRIDYCNSRFGDKDRIQGALLVSVMGGRLSEGINFSDDLGRCVVVVGMPYPNLGDPKLQLKLESLRAASSTTRSSSSSSSGVGSEDWSKRYYDALCMRSINQSIGRCIRHIRDYAVVLLLDERFNDTKIARQLPKWMQPRIMMNANFATISKATTDFFAGFVNQ